MSNPVERAAHDIDALPTDKREALWLAIWNGAIIGTMVLVMEYAVFSPLWNYLVIPAWEWLTA